MARGSCGSITGNEVGLGTVATTVLAPGAIVSVIRCSVGAPSECRVSSASLTCGTDFSGTRNRFDSPFGFIHRRRCARCRNPNGESNRFRVPEISGSQVNDALLTRHSDGAPTEHRMADTMAPGASSDCTKAYPIASDAPTTSPSHGNTSSVHGESPRPIPEKRYVLYHPGVHLPCKVLHTISYMGLLLKKRS